MPEEGQLTKKDSGVQYAAYVSGKKVFQQKEELRTKLRVGYVRRNEETYENVFWECRTNMDHGMPSLTKIRIIRSRHFSKAYFNDNSKYNELSYSLGLKVIPDKSQVIKVPKFNRKFA